MGSIQMSAISGLKSGLGISFVFSKLRSPLTQFYPELIIDDIESERFKEVMKKAKVVVFGPGMEEDQPIYQNIMDQLMETEIPLVIDAGGLSYIDINKSSSNPNVVLTPHIGEISKLFGVNSIEIMKDPFTYLHQLTEKGYHVILKGTTSMIAYEKQIIFMQAKNPGLATAGTGDVLAGMIAAFICRQVSLNALIDAFTLHAKTARIARKRHGQTSMIASHLIEAIDEVMIKEENND